MRIGRFFAGLRERGLYQEIVHVPLLVKRPGALQVAVVEDVVSQMDIFPTLLEAAGSGFEIPWARSLFGPRRRGADGWALTEFLSVFERDGATLETALRRGNLKYLASFQASSIEEVYASDRVKEAFYDLSADPGESRSLLQESGGAVAVAREALRSYLRLARAKHAGPAQEDETLDPDLLRKLESLGYIEH